MKLIAFTLFLALGSFGAMASGSTEALPECDPAACSPETCEVTVTCLGNDRCLVTCVDASGPVCERVVDCADCCDDPVPDCGGDCGSGSCG